MYITAYDYLYSFKPNIATYSVILWCPYATSIKIHTYVRVYTPS